MKFHDELNPKLWDKNNEEYTLKEEVKEKLKQIAEAFIDYLDIPQDSILDMVITGSSASYNYTPQSDLDLHIIVDYDKIHEDCPIVEGYLGALKSAFNKEHDIFIHGVPVELYAEEKDQGTVHNGLYSLNTGWIDVPKKIPPTDNDAAVEAKYQEIKDMIDKCENAETALDLLDKIYKMRKSGLADAGEFSTENLAFKKLRNEGVMNKLRQLKKQEVDKQLSLESYNESDDDLTNFCIIIDGDYNWLKEYGTFKSCKTAQQWLNKNGEEDWMYSQLTKGEMNDLGIDEFGYVNESINEEVLPHNIDKIKKLIQKVKESDYFKIDGEKISVNKGFGTVAELMDLEALAEKFEKLGFTVYVSHFYININGLKDFMDNNFNESWNNHSVQYQVIDRNDRISTKRKEFKTEKALQNWIAKQEDNPNFYGILATSYPDEINLKEDNDMQKWYKANRYLVKFDGAREDEVVYAHTKGLAREMAERKYGFAVKEVIFLDNNLDRENKYQENIELPENKTQEYLKSKMGRSSFMVSCDQKEQLLKDLTKAQLNSYVIIYSYFHQYAEGVTGANIKDYIFIPSDWTIDTIGWNNRKIPLDYLKNNNLKSYSKNGKSTGYGNIGAVRLIWKVMTLQKAIETYDSWQCSYLGYMYFSTLEGDSHKKCLRESIKEEKHRQEFIDKHIVDESVNTTKLKTEIENKIKEFFKNDEDALEWAMVEVAQNSDQIKIEVRVELDYNGMWNLSELLNPIVSKYDKYAYFDFEQPGIMVATIEVENDIIGELSELKDDNMSIKKLTEELSKLLEDNWDNFAGHSLPNGDRDDEEPKKKIYGRGKDVKGKNWIEEIVDEQTINVLGEDITYLKIYSHTEDADPNDPFERDYYFWIIKREDEEKIDNIEKGIKKLIYTQLGVAMDAYGGMSRNIGFPMSFDDRQK